MNPFTKPKIRNTANRGRINGNICIQTVMNDWAMFAIPVQKTATSAGSTVTSHQELTVAHKDNIVIIPKTILVNTLIIFTKN